LDKWKIKMMMMMMMMMMIRPVGCPETWIQNYHSTQHKIPKQCRSQPSHIYCTISSVQKTQLFFLKVN
jgi:hypothetical protein